MVIVFTGEGKGKTSAAMGLALRSAGHDMYVSVIQFIKSPQMAGEARAAERLAPKIEFLSTGKGFVNTPSNPVPFADHRKAARDALVLARKQIAAGSWDVIILDEITVALRHGLLDIDDVVELIRNKPPKLHLVLTGRDAPDDLIALADLVTEMKAVKHPYDSGVQAQRGIDY